LNHTRFDTGIVVTESFVASNWLLANRQKQMLASRVSAREDVKAGCAER